MAGSRREQLTWRSASCVRLYSVCGQGAGGVPVARQQAEHSRATLCMQQFSSSKSQYTCPAGATIRLKLRD